VIGAGLQALDKNEDSAAVKGLFYMFAVTMEDFVHPIAVIELLWRSCCASESEKEEGSLMARLKVRQRTQMLVDHSLLLGSSSEGIHLHDLVLQYLRKRLSAEEMRMEQTKVVEGMIAASQARVAETGRGFEETGSTASACAGEEVDFYCCNVGAWHVTRARDPSRGMVEDECLQRWCLTSDRVIVKATALAIGCDELKSAAVHFQQEGELAKAAKVHHAIAQGSLATRDGGGLAHEDAAIAIIEQIEGTLGDDIQQIRLDILLSRATHVRGEEQKRINAKIEAILSSIRDCIPT